MGLLEFVGKYWWLVFPLGGAIGSAFWSVSGWLASQGEARHKRRLEIIRAKNEARALQLPSGAQVDEQGAHMDASTRTQRLERLFGTHDEVTSRWLDYELDVAKTIAFPTMSDGREPLTAAFLRAKKKADGLRPASATAKIDADTLAEYRDAVHDAEVAFDVAEQHARRVRDSGFTESERKRLERAQHLLRTAVDQSATSAERQTAYRRVREELDGLIALSDGAVDVLKKRVAPELTA